MSNASRTARAVLPSKPYEKLAQNVDLVAKNYFVSSKRLQLHDVLSQWTLSLLSLGLIILPLCEVFDLTQAPEKMISFMSITLAVVVLVFSLLIGVNKHGLRADRMHVAGLDFNNLLRKMRGNSDAQIQLKEYGEFNRQYDEILRRCENVDDIDYIRGKLNTKKNEPISCLRVRLEIKHLMLLIINFSIYIIALILETGVIAALIF